MKIVIPFEGRVRMCIRSSFVMAQRVDEAHFNLNGESFSMMDVTREQVCIFPDETELTEGMELTAQLLACSLPLEQFIHMTAEDAMPNALGLLLRLAVTDGRVTDEELLSIQPALEGRMWKPGIEALTGDVYMFGGSLWCCVQTHKTQSDWPPNEVPALWRKVEVVTQDKPRVWQESIAYQVGDIVVYPDENGASYACIQAHTSQVGWQPPNVPALWKAAQMTERVESAQFEAMHELP